MLQTFSASIDRVPYFRDKVPKVMNPVFEIARPVYERWLCLVVVIVDVGILAYWNT